MKTKNSGKSKSNKTSKTQTITAKTVDKTELKKVLLNVVMTSRKKQKDIWLREIAEFDEIIKEAYFSGAPKLKILKSLHGLGFKIPHSVFQIYFAKHVMPVKMKTQKPAKQVIATNKQEKKITETAAALPTVPQMPTEPGSPIVKSSAPPGSRRKSRPGGFRIAGDNL